MSRDSPTNCASTESVKSDSSTTIVPSENERIDHTPIVRMSQISHIKGTGFFTQNVKNARKVGNKEIISGIVIHQYEDDEDDVSIALVFSAYERALFHINITNLLEYEQKESLVGYSIRVVAEYQNLIHRRIDIHDHNKFRKSRYAPVISDTPLRRGSFFIRGDDSVLRTYAISSTIYPFIWTLEFGYVFANPELRSIFQLDNNKCFVVELGLIRELEATQNEHFNGLVFRVVRIVDDIDTNSFHSKIAELRDSDEMSRYSWCSPLGLIAGQICNKIMVPESEETS